MSVCESSTQMYREAAQAADAVRVQLRTNSELMEKLGATLRALAPRAVITCARGSSDHAATFAKYLIETRMGILTSSAAPSVSSVYAATPILSDTLFLAISQSGASPDLLAAVASAKSAGAYVVALVNAEASPLSCVADCTIPLCAGAEKSVAATKSYITALAAIVHLVASWRCDQGLQQALARAPEQLDRAWQLDWSTVLEDLKTATNIYVIGRGLGLSVAQEAALKFKETCDLHAEAFSAAEVRHGPMAIVHAGFPVMLFTQNDQTRAGVETLASELAQRGAHVMLAGPYCPGATMVPMEDAHPVIEPMLVIQSFYRLANALSLARGCDPDHPPYLHKITETL